MKLRACSYVVAIALSSSVVGAQTRSPAGSPPANPGANSVLQPQLGQLDQAARQTVVDLGRLRVEKWKTDADAKQQARDNVDSLEKNLSSALPALVQQVESNPASVGAAVKLYHNLNVVYDVLSSVVESTGAFGSKDDYQALATDVANLDNVRRNIADTVEQMATSQDLAYARLANEVRMQQAAAAAEPPKKVIVDDTEPAPKKTVKKKKKTTSAASTATTPQ